MQIFEWCTYGIFGQEINYNWTKYAGQCSDSVGQTHQYAGIFWCNIQMIHIIAGYSKATECYTKREGNYSASLQRYDTMIKITNI